MEAINQDAQLPKNKLDVIVIPISGIRLAKKR